MSNDSTTKTKSSSIDETFSKIQSDAESATEQSTKEMQQDMDAIWKESEKDFDKLAKQARKADTKKRVNSLEESSSGSSSSSKFSSFKASAKENLKKTVRHEDAWMGFLVILLVLVLYYDAVHNGFARAGASLTAWLVIYSVFGVLLWLSLRGGVDDLSLAKMLVPRVILMVVTPILARLLADTLSSFISQYIFFASLTAQGIAWWTPLIIMYFWGLPGFATSPLKGSENFLAKIANVVHTVAVLLVILALIVPLGNAIGETSVAQSAGVSEYQYEPLTAGEMLWTFWDVLADSTITVIGGVRSEYNESFSYATQRSYTGQVERQQGRALGVFVRDLRPEKSLYHFDVRENDSLAVGTDRQVLWFGDLEASTFADEMNVSLGCVYEYPVQGSDEREEVIGSVRPNRPLSIRYTGSEFTDVYPFDCSMSMQEILAEAGALATRGQFYTTANFSFETWGYSTVTFMDSQVINEYRREGTDPARELGIESTVQSVYTPGPLSLGMLDRQRLPFRVDLQQPDSNYLPAFGVTLQNRWQAQGEVTSFKELVLQVPEVFELDTADCAGYEGAVDHRTRGAQLGELEVPDGFRWYVFEDINMSADVSQKTIRCPLRVRGGEWGRLLGADLSPQQFTLVARASYDFETRTRAPVSLTVSRV